MSLNQKYKKIFLIIGFFIVIVIVDIVVVKYFSGKPSSVSVSNTNTNFIPSDKKTEEVFQKANLDKAEECSAGINQLREGLGWRKDLGYGDWKTQCVEMMTDSGIEKFVKEYFSYQVLLRKAGTCFPEKKGILIQPPTLFDEESQWIISFSMMRKVYTEKNKETYEKMKSLAKEIEGMTKDLNFEHPFPLPGFYEDLKKVYEGKDFSEAQKSAILPGWFTTGEDVDKRLFKLEEDFCKSIFWGVTYQQK